MTEGFTEAPVMGISLVERELPYGYVLDSREGRIETNLLIEFSELALGICLPEPQPPVVCNGPCR